MYGDVLLLHCSVFMQPSMGTVKSTRWFIHFRSSSIKETQQWFFLMGVCCNFSSLKLFWFLPAGSRSLWENAGGSNILHTSLHGGNGSHLWTITRGGEEEDQLSEAGLSLHPQTSWHHQQREVSGQVCEPVWGQCIDDWVNTSVYKCLLCHFKHDSVSWCQCEGGVQWTPPYSDVHRWAGWPQMVEEQPWTWDAH